MIIKRDFIYSPKGTNRPLHIYLPDDYFDTEERYPVMYFFDGHNLFSDQDATYGKSWGMKEFMDESLATSDVVYPSQEIQSHGSSYSYLPEDISRFVESLFMEVRNS